MLLHADCTKDDQWRAAVASLKACLKDTTCASLFNAACEAFWTATCQEELSMADSMLALKNALLCTGSDELVGFELLESIIWRGELDDKSSLRQKINEHLSAVPGINQRQLDIMLKSEELDTQALVSELIRPEMKESADLLVSGDPKKILDGFCKLAQLPHNNIEDETVCHLVETLSSSNIAGGHPSNRHLRPDDRMDSAIRPILRRSYMESLCNPLIDLCKYTHNESSRKSCVRKILIESLFYAFPIYVQGDDIQIKT